MRTMLYAFFTFLLFMVALPETVRSQGEAPNVYHVFDFMKVEQGMESDYIQIEQLWKKIHEAKIKAGQLGSWALLAVASPFGDNCAYNYVTRNTYIGDDQLIGHFENDFFPENWESLFTREEVELLNKTTATRKLVKEEVWQSLDQTMAENMSDAKVVIFNYFKRHEGKTAADHVKEEKEVWKPVHEARVKDGKMKGWVLMGLAMPMGANQPYTEATIDIYTSMKDMVNTNFTEYFEKVHPGKNANEMMNKVGTIVDRADVQMWQVVDLIAPPGN